MARKPIKENNNIASDYKYKSKLLMKFINYVMKSGKKSIAQNIVYNALDIIKKIKNCNPVISFEQAITFIKPEIEVKSKRVGGANYQIPVEIRHKRAASLAMRWLLKFAAKRNERNISMKLAYEIIDASNYKVNTGSSKGCGGAIRKREDTHRMAEANKTFSHFKF